MHDEWHTLTCGPIPGVSRSPASWGVSRSSASWGVSRSHVQRGVSRLPVQWGVSMLPVQWGVSRLPVQWGVSTLPVQWEVSRSSIQWGVQVMLLPALGRVTDCGVRGFGFKSRARFLHLEKKPVLYHEWSGMVEAHALHRYVGEKKSPIRWSLRLGRWTSTTVHKTTLKLKEKTKTI